MLAAVHHCGHSQTLPVRESTRVPDTPCPKEQTPLSTTSSNPPITENTPSLTALDALSEHQRQTADGTPTATTDPRHTPNNTQTHPTPPPLSSEGKKKTCRTLKSPACPVH
eukprot:scaffold30136_cov129-Isochrysis_galbana.AAC.1